MAPSPHHQQWLHLLDVSVLKRNISFIASYFDCCAPTVRKKNSIYSFTNLLAISSQITLIFFSWTYVERFALVINVPSRCEKRLFFKMHILMKKLRNREELFFLDCTVGKCCCKLVLLPLTAKAEGKWVIYCKLDKIIAGVCSLFTII